MRYKVLQAGIIVELTDEQALELGDKVELYDDSAEMDEFDEKAPPEPRMYPDIDY